MTHPGKAARDQDWDALLQEQEQFLAVGRREDQQQAARVLRQPPPAIARAAPHGGVSEDSGGGGGGGSSGHPSSRPGPSYFAQATKQAAATASAAPAGHPNPAGDNPPNATTTSSSSAVFLSDRMADKGFGSGLKPMPVPVLRPMNIGPARSFPAAGHRSQGPFLGRPKSAPAPPQAPAPSSSPHTGSHGGGVAPQMTPLAAGGGGKRSGGGGVGNDETASMLAEISARNDEVVAGMTPGEVEEALVEATSVFSAEALAFLKNRSRRKREAADEAADAAATADAAARAPLRPAPAAAGQAAAEQVPAAPLLRDGAAEGTGGAEARAFSAEGAGAAGALLTAVRDDDALAAAVQAMPAEERLKHAWMEPLDRETGGNGRVDGGGGGGVHRAMPPLPGPAGTRPPVVPAAAAIAKGAVKPHVVGGAQPSDGDEDGGGQRWDLDGWPVLPEATALHVARPGTGTGTGTSGASTGRGVVKAGDHGGGGAGTCELDGAGELPMHLGLHHHGREPLAAGYTLDELCVLARSLSPPQRLAATRGLARSLRSSRSLLNAASAAAAAAAAAVSATANDAAVNGAAVAAGGAGAGASAEAPAPPYLAGPAAALALVRRSGNHGAGPFASERPGSSTPAPPGPSGGGGGGGAAGAPYPWLRPLRLPLQLPLLAADLLNDGSLAVRAEACHLLLALADDDPDDGAAAPLRPRGSSSGGQGGASRSITQGDGASAEGGLFETWRGHLAAPPLPLSPFRRLVAGQVRRTFS